VGLSPGSSGPLPLPADVFSVPDGTELVIDQFGDVIVTGRAGNSGQFRAAVNPAAGVSFLDANAGLNIGSVSGQIILSDGAGNQYLGVNTTSFRLRGWHAAPGAANLQAGDMAVWFDQTNGASKLMVQAKSANGTLVAGSLALA